MGKHKAKNHKAAGINKSVSTPMYWGDLLADGELRKCSLAARGFWLFGCLPQLLHDKTDRVSGSYPELARLCSCTPAEARRATAELKNTNACRVTISNGNVTLVNRRQERVLKERKAATARTAKSRANAAKKAENTEDTQRDNEDAAAPCNTLVTVEKPLPSSSSSFSPSVTKVTRGGKPPHIFLSELKIQLEVLKDIKRGLFEKGDKTSKAKGRELIEKIKTLQLEIANYGNA